MSRLSRYTQQIFGSAATANQIAEFGSLANSTPLTYSGTTITPAIVQTLSQYLSGWFAAVNAAYSPNIEDMNALCYLFAYQLTYLMQVGIAEWDSGTTYYIGDLVQDGTGVIYASTTNSNLNNALTTTNWSAPLQNGVLTTNSLTKSSTVVSGTSLTWPELTVASPNTLTINSGAYYFGAKTLTIASGATMTILGSAYVSA